MWPRTVTRRRRAVLVVAGAIGLVACGAPGATSPPGTGAGTAVTTVPTTGAGDDAPAAAASAAGAAAGRIDSPAVATTDADREIDRALGASCDLGLVGSLAGRHPGVEQFVTVVTDSWVATTARLELVAFDGDEWVCQTSAMVAMVGRNGTTPLTDRRSGDGTTPAGVFPLGTQTAWDGQRFQFFGNAPDPGVRGSYRSVRDADCWGATPGATTYQQLYEREGCPGPDDEWLPRFGDVYSHAAVIGANLDDVSGDAPGEPAYAAAIFLHRHNYAGGTEPRPTSGCVSLVAADLVSVLRSLDPDLTPHFAIGPHDWLAESA